MAVKVKQNKVNIPSKKIIDFLIEGSKVFHPDVFFSKSRKADASRVDIWVKHKIKREDFDSLLTSYTKTNIYDIDNAINTLKEWQVYLSEAENEEIKTPEELETTVPDKELLEEMEEDMEEFVEKGGKQSPLDLEQQIKTLTKNAQEKKEEAEKLEASTKPKAPEPQRPASAEEVKASTPLYEAPKPSTSPQPSNVDVKPPDKKLYITPTKSVQPIELADLETEILLNDINSANTDPAKFATELTKKITSNESVKKQFGNIPEDSFTQIAHETAFDYTKRLQLLGNQISESPNKTQALKQIKPPPNTASVLNAFSNPNNPEFSKFVPNPSVRTETASHAQTLAVGAATFQDTSNIMLVPIYSNNIVSSLYGPREIQQYKISDRQSPNSLQFDFKKLFSVGRKYQNIVTKRNTDIHINPQNIAKFLNRDWQSTINNFSWKGVKGFSSELFSTISKPAATPTANLAIGSSRSFLTSSSLFSSWTTTGTPVLSYSRAITSIASNFTGIDFAFFAEVAAPYIAIDAGGAVVAVGVGAAEAGGSIIAAAGAEAATAAVVVGTETAAVAAVGTTTGAAAGAAAGSVVPIVGTAIGAAIGAIGAFISTKVLSKLTSDPKKTLLVGASIFVILSVLVSPIFIVPAIFLGAGLLTAAATGTAVGTGVAGFFGAIYVGFTTLFIGSIVVPLIVAFIAIPTIIALVIFIINSGAYIVPPAGGGVIQGSPGAIESPWIGVTKTANPSKFENNQLPQKVSYTIEVWAKKSALTNISFNNVCKVRKENNVPTCNHPVPDPDDMPKTMSPTNPEHYKYTYEVEYNSNYEDSLVIDTFEVTADAGDQNKAFATAVAFVTIGDPPSECPVLWPVSGEQRITQGPGQQHSGSESIDIGVGTGTPVLVTHSGEVVTSKWDLDSTYGNYIDVESTCDGTVFVSRYAHLSSRAVKKNDPVSIGQTIGLSGGTGGWTPHLHYEFKNLLMKTTYIPRAVPLGCTKVSVCGYTIPSN